MRPLLFEFEHLVLVVDPNRTKPLEHISADKALYSDVRLGKSRASLVRCCGFKLQLPMMEDHDEGPT